MNENLIRSADTAAFMQVLAAIAAGTFYSEPPEGFKLPSELSGLPKNTPLLLGFSGGADSSVLLFYSYLYAKEHGAPLRLVHLHHGIRGAEADRDAAFAKEIAKLYGLPLSLVYRDIPAIAREHGESIETAARRTRYEVFAETMREYDIPLLLTAHNADDNLETVLFHLLRGSGLSGLCGIPPVRETAEGRVIRPLLETPRIAIEAAAERYHIPFVFDSTNGDTAYTRNKLRKEILPLFREIAPNPEKAVSRTSAALRRDREYLDTLATQLLSDADTGNGLDRKVIADAPDPVALRALLAYWQTAVKDLDSYSSIHLDALLDFTKNGRSGTHLSLRKATASLENGVLRILPTKGRQKHTEIADFTHILTDGENELPALGISLFLGSPEEARAFLSRIPARKVDENTKNIYNSATQILLSFDTIKERVQNAPLTVRPRLPGDRIFSRGMHRSLRTLCNEAHIPPEERKRLPVILLGDEILWIPGLAVRDGVCTELSEHASGKALILFALPNRASCGI